MSIKKIFSKAWVKYTLTGIICLFIGVSMGGSSQDLETKNKELADKNIKLETQVKDLKAKVDEAKPYFAMNQVEKDKVDQKAKEEKAKLEEQKAKVEAEKRAKEEKEEADRKAKEEANKKAALEAKTKTFSSGKYEAGKDFDAGKYNVVAVHGGGNVICMGAGLNAVMGVDQGEYGDMYQKEYKNITFETGQVLDIRDVKIKLIPVE